MKVVKVLRRTVWLVVMSALSLIMLYPLVYSAIGGLNTQKEMQTLGSILPVPEVAQWNNYLRVFSTSSSILQTLLNTVFRTAWYTVLAMVVAVLVGYVLTRYEFKGKNVFILIMILGQVIPTVLTIIPTFVLVSNIPLVGGNDIWGNGGQGLYNNILMLYLPFGFSYLLWPFLFMRSLKSMPAGFEEAAQIDGANFWQILIHVVVPMQKPILTVVAINVALNTWNDWLRPFLYINDTARTTLPAYVAKLTASLMEFSVMKDYPGVFSLATVAIIPPLIVFLFLQKYIVQGIASAGVKG